MTSKSERRKYLLTYIYILKGHNWAWPSFMKVERILLDLIKTEPQSSLMIFGILWFSVLAFLAWQLVVDMILMYPLINTMCLT